MKSVNLGLIGALALAGTAYAQVPNTNDTSDGNANTGMGTGALGGPTPVNLTGTRNTASGAGALAINTSGGGNTASGASALANNTTGSFNTASGYEALVFNTTGNDNSASGAYALRSSAPARRTWRVLESRSRRNKNSQAI
jgi:trimeric autotransporter adhesin